MLSAILWSTVQFMPSQDPPAQSPAASADNSQSPAQNSSPQDKAGANERIQTSIRDLLKSDPVVDGADVEVSVDDHNIVLSGKVESYAQHQRVLQLVAQYGKWRQIVDQIKME
jgi:osmotically-inducible protein OsmY